MKDKEPDLLSVAKTIITQILHELNQHVDGTCLENMVNVLKSKLLISSDFVEDTYYPLFFDSVRYQTTNYYYCRLQNKLSIGILCGQTFTKKSNYDFKKHVANTRHSIKRNGHKDININHEYNLRLVKSYLTNTFTSDGFDPKTLLTDLTVFMRYSYHIGYYR